MYKKLTHKVRIEGKGNIEDQTIANALGRIQKKVNAELKGMIIRIEPMKIEIVEATEETYNERFLMLFFPRKRSLFRIVMDVEVDLFILDTDQINFIEKKR
ncbi:DUF4312 family protein [Bacillus massiliglaciei]|uniref:DUF4312 family protein n=1 Tax=Bacillus massiliglaciei TaxID=1816693 RepID=UPI0018FE7E4F|nr:DUF4312 family protein [Bacillus massiliglaciei]